MRRILITGGAGFIGANFVHYWMTQYPNDKIIILDALTYAGNVAHLESLAHLQNYYFIHGNICDQSLVTEIFLTHKINTVVHFAAESHVDRSITNPDDFMTTNVLGTHTLLKIAHQFWKNTHVKNHFHHVSTDEVYGSLSLHDLPFTEKSPYAPNSPYAASKAASDHLARAYYHTYGLPVTISNCSNNYGHYQHYEKFIPTVIQACLEWKLIPIYSNGSNIRDWLHVDDHCYAIELILTNGKIGETYNVGASNEMSNIALAKKICEIMDQLKPMHQPYESLISFVNDRPGHDFRYAIHAEKIKRELNFSPKINFDNGLMQTIQYHLKQSVATL